MTTPVEVCKSAQMRRLVVVVLIALSALTACGDGGGTDGGSGGGEAGGGGDTADTARATDALLEVGDLPAGWSKAPDEDTGEDDDDEEFCEALDPNDKIEPNADVESNFEHSATGQYLSQNVVLYDDAEQAAEVMELLRGAFEECQTFSNTVGGEQFTGTLAEAPAPSVGDEALGARIAAEANGVKFGADLLFVRSGRGITGLFHFGLNPTPALAESLAPKAVDELRSATV